MLLVAAIVLFGIGFIVTLINGFRGPLIVIGIILIILILIMLYLYTRVDPDEEEIPIFNGIVICPECRSKKVILIDHGRLHWDNNESEAAPQYITGVFDCIDCGHQFIRKGEIIWNNRIN